MTIVMLKHVLQRFGFYSLTAAGGIYFGVYLERTTSLHKSHASDSTSLFENLPALPIFGTVSAAVPVPNEELKLELQKDRGHGEKVTTHTGQIMKYGFPSLDNVRNYQDFVLAYDQRNRVAHWVFEHLNKDKLLRSQNVDRSKCNFKEDTSIHEFFRANNQDYKQSGFDRGHLAAAGNHRLSQEHVNETFLLSNIAPQVGVGFNRDAWNDLEKYVRKLTRIHKNVYVCTGPLYLPRKESDGKSYVKYQVIGASHVAVPTHFFKVLVMENDKDELEMEAYVMPNQVIENGTPLQVFQVPPESVERASGLLFFNRLSRSKLRRINNKKL